MLFAAFRPQTARRLKSHSLRTERTRISYFTALPAATYAALRKESRMKSTEATVLDRKSRGSRGICGAPRLPHRQVSGWCAAGVCTDGRENRTEDDQGRHQSKRPSRIVLP